MIALFVKVYENSPSKRRKERLQCSRPALACSLTRLKVDSYTQETTRQQILHRRGISSLWRRGGGDQLMQFHCLMKTLALIITHLAKKAFTFTSEWHNSRCPAFERGHKSMLSCLLTIKWALKFYTVFMICIAGMIYVRGVSHSL